MNRGRAFTEKVKKTILRHGMISPGDKVVIAVSGGPDSVCLLHVLHMLSTQLRHELVVAHFDHGWRPGEDEIETELVRKLAQSLKVPFETGKADSFKSESMSSVEEAAREARYGFLERVRQKHAGQRIALGHNLNDQSETLLMRLLRGSGATGLAAIPPIREHIIIRPLIEVQREEIESYLEEMDLSYAIDSSNRNTDLLRNRIRLELVPLLLEYQPRLVEHLGETASILREESEFLDSVSTEWVSKEANHVSEAKISIPIRQYLSLPEVLRKRVLRRILSMVKGNIRRIGRKHIQSIDDLASSGKPQASLDLPDRMTVRRTYDLLHFMDREEDASMTFSYVIEGPGILPIKEIGRSLSLLVREKGERGPSASPRTAYLDAEKATFPLLVRNFRPGDRFVPLGMKGHKKLKDFFVDLKVPFEIRRSTPILVRNDIPVWVAGYRIDERFKITPTTRVVLEASLV
jgi:tRNA(Ile)-lysidine synthase